MMLVQRVAALAFLLTYAVVAQIITKPTIADITLAPSGSPDFQAMLDQLGAGQASQLGPLIPYFVGLRANVPLSSVAVLWAFDDGHRTVTAADVIEPANMQAGDVRLLAPRPLDTLASAITSHRGLTGAGSVSSMLSGKTITCSIDSVTHPDGTFVGPDALKLYERLGARQKKTLEFLGALQARLKTSSDADVRAWLANTEATAVSPSHSIFDTDLAGSAVRIQAMTALETLANNGHGALVAWADAEAKAQSKPNLHK
jgi:hypothetical protein